MGNSHEIEINERRRVASHEDLNASRPLSEGTSLKLRGPPQEIANWLHARTEALTIWAFAKLDCAPTTVERKLQRIRAQWQEEDAL